MSTLIAFHGQPEIKEKYLSRLAAHRAADELIHGTAWENGKGCAIGCTLNAYDHARYETELGIPQMLARLEDVIFEGLPNGDAQAWPERFLGCISPGKNLSLVGWQFLYWLFQDTQERYATPAVKKACEPVGLILADLAVGKSVSPSTESAESAAQSAARSAASAARSAASAAQSAASAAQSAESAAQSAESAAYKRIADKLIELLEAA